MAESPHATVKTIYIRDNGLGFPEGSSEKVFLPFQRFHRNLSKGEGIGLALVRKIILRNQGRIWFTSESGTGTTFYVSLPATKPDYVYELGGNTGSFPVFRDEKDAQGNA
jgi:signal transduction histidine kinase